ncbi:MAG: hypothetical protein R3F55_01560 [Alphaproteobacteria bacterium]
MKASGICGSDLHFYRAEDRRPARRAGVQALPGPRHGHGGSSPGMSPVA